MACDHRRERLGVYRDVTGRRAAVERAVEWCPVCRSGYLTNVAFEDGLRWTEAERVAAHNAGIAERRRLLGLVNARRMAVALEIAHGEADEGAD